MNIKMTKKMPKKEGLYLYRSTKHSDIEFLDITKDLEGKGELWANDYPRCRSCHPLNFDGYWFGPIKIS